MLYEPTVIGAIALMIALQTGRNAEGIAARLAMANIRATQGSAVENGSVAAQCWPQRYRDNGDYVAAAVGHANIADIPAETEVAKAFDTTLKRYTGWRNSADRRALRQVL